MNAIECGGLIKRYGAATVVDHLDLQVRQGECFGLLGPNGAGKTTTTEMLEGLIPSDGGEMRLLGESWGNGHKDRFLRERLGVALQQTELPDRLTVAETIALFRSFYATGLSVDELLDTLELKHKADAWVMRLSGGERQRLALATALVGKPDILFLDEPTTGLDPQARHRIWEVVERFREGGGTIFLTTHYMEEAERLCDSVGIMDRGKLIAYGSPNALIESLHAAQMIEFRTKGKVDLVELRAIEGVESVSVLEDGLVQVKVSRLETVLLTVLDLLKNAGLGVEFLKTRRTTLEDVFVSKTGRTLLDA